MSTDITDAPDVVADVAVAPPLSQRAKTMAYAAVPYVIAVLAAFVVVGVLITLLGHDPAKAFRAVLTNSFRNETGLVQTLHKWAPLTLLSLAFAIPLGAGRFNIGGEGQMILGSVGAAAVGITMSDLPMVILLPLVLVVGTLAGVVWAAISAWLMESFHINEILSTVLLNFVSFEVLDYIASVVWSDPGAGGAVTLPIGDGAVLPGIGRPPMHTGVLLVVLVSVVAAVMAKRSVAGFELRAVGLNERASKLHGIRTGRVAVMSMVVAGGLAGLAGAIEVSGVHQRTLEGIQSNFLLLGIIIGLIARGSLAAVPFVAFGIAVLEVGAGSMQRVSGAPVEIVLILEGLILLFLLMSDVATERLRRARAGRSARRASVAAGPTTTTGAAA
ncbi:sugar ABC transporter, permease protein [Janibacter sp. HTCC2649]|uniref:ABC transporter permease n=1 Tax=Janibacter sp. HTCC2649 TaxID=313589 RepID=UPI0000671A10|nr:ABC transporter permease [Janibacter sp. HTCC2649]EAP97784.1 sugar ABC transporter, permease protein [Janibacter sp. HTCC2649]